MGEALVVRRGSLEVFRPIQATGGTITDIGDYRYHAFTSTGNSTFSVQNTGSSGEIEYLVVAGGGSGGVCYGGGGGAGGFLEGSTTINAQNYTVTVGNGGTAIFNTGSNGNKGQNSSAFGIVAEGGGFGGGTCGGSGGSGGSGGGGSANGGSGGSGNAGPPRQGFNGSVNQTSGAPDHGGGGGGAGDAAVNTVFGGVGKISTIVPATLANTLNIGDVSGNNVYFSGGGSGASNFSGGRAGALGGGGRGGSGQTNPEYAAAKANTGGGGGGMVITGPGGVSGRGGSGIVIIRYPLQAT